MEDINYTNIHKYTIEEFLLQITTKMALRQLEYFGHNV